MTDTGQDDTVLHIYITPAVKAEPWRSVIKDCQSTLRAVVFEGYANGNGPHWMLPLVEEFLPQDVLLFMTSQLPDRVVAQGKYEVGANYRNAGVIGLNGVSALEALEEIEKLASQGTTNEEIVRHMNRIVEERAPAMEAEQLRIERRNDELLAEMDKHLLARGMYPVSTSWTDGDVLLR